MRLIKLYFLLLVLVLASSCNNEEGKSDNNLIPSNKELNILWLGTSIPEGCTYPENSCTKLGFKCSNMSIGASFLSVYNSSEKGEMYAGLSLTETIAEKYDKYFNLVKEGKIKEETYEQFKKASFESILSSKIKETDIIIIDHGYNDNISLYKLYDNRISIPDNDSIWYSKDRSNFIGAFNYLQDKIKEANPNVSIIIGGYFQNNCTVGHSIRGKYVAYALTDISRHYGIPCLDTWNYTKISDGYMPHSEQYIDSINQIYKTHFTKWNPNEKGEITYFQRFCPDTVHPFSDPTGKSNEELDSIFTTLLPQKIIELYKKQKK